MNKRFKIPVVWQMYGHVFVEAETLDEAFDIALSDRVGLPDNGEYISASFEIDYEGIPEDYQGENI